MHVGELVDSEMPAFPLRGNSTVHSGLHGYHVNQEQEAVHVTVTLCIMSILRSSNKLLSWNSTKFCVMVYAKVC